jgi:hypothetical protein
VLIGAVFSGDDHTLPSSVTSREDSRLSPEQTDAVDDATAHNKQAWARIHPGLPAAVRPGSLRRHPTTFLSPSRPRKAPDA